MTEQQSAFWTFSLTVYADPGVQKECLDLQDHYGVDVNLLLFCAYLGAVHGVVPSDAQIRQVADVVAVWHERVIGRLREARRALKPFATETSQIASIAMALRMRVKDTELEAERVEQIMLEEWGTAHVQDCERAQPSAAVTANIRTLLAMNHGCAGKPNLPNRLIAAALATAS